MTKNANKVEIHQLTNKPNILTIKGILQDNLKEDTDLDKAQKRLAIDFIEQLERNSDDMQEIIDSYKGWN